MRTRVKICGITRIKDAAAAVELGADAIGFVFSEGSPRCISIEQAKKIAAEIPPFIAKVGVFTVEDSSVREIMEAVHLDYAQLHGGQSDEFAKSIGAERVIRAIRVSGAESLCEMEKYPSAAAYLLDTWHPNLLGGSGISFDWNIACDAVKSCRRIILAGGLVPGNICKAIITVRPFAVDVSSGVESAPGIKEYKKMEELFNNVRLADESAG